MARKPDPNAPPPGGWLGPGEIDPKDPTNLIARDRKAIAHAKGSRVVRGKLVWNWKPGPAPRAAEAPAPKIRVRTRK